MGQGDRLLHSRTARVNIGEWGLRRGKAALEKLFKVDIAGNNKGKGRDGHFAIQPVINVDGERADGHWLMYVMISDAETGGAKRWNHGRHDVEYARVDGQWKIDRYRLHQPLAARTRLIPEVAARRRVAVYSPSPRHGWQI